MAEATDVHLLETLFEIYAIVPDTAHTKRKEILAALRSASLRADNLDKRADRGNRPFRPPIHVLLLPSLIPLDLAALLRQDLFPSEVSVR